MKTRQPEWRAIPQFDCGRWKLRLERVPFYSDTQTNDEHHPWVTTGPKRQTREASHFSEASSFESLRKELALGN